MDHEAIAYIRETLARIETNEANIIEKVKTLQTESTEIRGRVNKNESRLDKQEGKGQALSIMLGIIGGLATILAIIEKLT